MANRLSLTADKEVIEERFGSSFQIPLVYQPRYIVNGIHLESSFIIPMEHPKEIRPAIWSLIPQKALEDMRLFEKRYGDYFGFARKHFTWNIEVGQVFKKRFYVGPIMKRRCLVLADGFFIGPRSKDENVHYYHLKDEKDNRGLFAMAGIYSWIDTDLLSFTVLTVPSKKELQNVTGFVPLVLDRDFEREWLRPDLTREGIKGIFKAGFVNESFKTHMVDWNLLKYGQNTDPDIIKAV